MRVGGDNFVKRWGRQLAFDLPRFTANAASRKRVAGVLASIVFTLLAIVVCVVPVAYLEWRFMGRWWAAFLMVTLCVLAAAAWRWTTRGRRPHVILNLSIRRSPTLREGVLRQRAILASLVDRAEFEAHLAMAEVQPEGGMRARLIERLRHRRMWDSVPLPLQKLLSEPEGSWHRERIRRVLLQLDAVQVLSWAVTEEYELPSLRTAADVNPDILRVALAKADRRSEAQFLRSWDEIDGQMAPVKMYLDRLHNELIKRRVTGGTFDEALEQKMEAYMVYAASTGEVELVAEDLPVGGRLVAEAGSEELINLRAIAAVRYMTLESLRAAVGAGTTAVFEEQNGWITEKMTLHM